MALDLLLLLELETVVENGSKIDSNCLPKIVPVNAEGSCHLFFTHSVHHFVKQFLTTVRFYAGLTCTFFTSVTNCRFLKQLLWSFDLSH